MCSSSRNRSSAACITNTRLRRRRRARKWSPRNVRVMSNRVFAENRVYGGLNLDGTVVTPSDDWNASFYGKKVLPPDILVRTLVHNAAADKLLAQVSAAANNK